MMAESVGLCLLRLSEGDIEQDPLGAVQKLTEALKQMPDDAENYCQRAYAHILLQNYHDAITDAEKSLTLDPNNAVAFLRQGIGEYHMKNYGSALKSLSEGQKLGSADTTFTIWIKRCEEAINRLQTEMDDNQIFQHPSCPSKIKYDWYQTESHVIITIMIKNTKKEDVNITFSEKELDALVRLSSEEDYNLKLHLLHSIVPEQSTFKVLSTKIEIKMKKPEAVRWENLEGHGGSPKLKQIAPVSDATHLYPPSSHYTRNWDKLVVEIKEEEKHEKLEGDAALNKLFQQIYSDGTDEVKRAMNKSFMESGGTVLSTNWSDVGKRKVEVNPPDDMEWKKF
ncbi:protein SGT1 homolog isoform X2 [Rhineura floridana]|uniref:protein SGT1 homolog isoform X2 n=1 Tax=Rhineura floridana TaxID=261503 RepID=UPI002AC88A39|nr:protein SGT1 homolog isoform X2 [Rhineura floridana]